MSDAITRYPLAWPIGWPRTPAATRQRARFLRVSKSTGTYRTGETYERTERNALSVADGLGRLTIALRRLNGYRVILSSNVELRQDGWPMSGRREPTDPGAAVYFVLSGRDKVLACDRWDRTADNLAALAEHIDALRAIDRYGVGTLEQAFAGYAQLAAHVVEPSWWEVLEIEVPEVATAEAIERAYRRLARTRHPDKGGSHEAMARLNAARDAALRIR